MCESRMSGARGGSSIESVPGIIFQPAAQCLGGEALLRKDSIDSDLWCSGPFPKVVASHG